MSKNRISKLKDKESMAYLEQSTCGFSQESPTWLSPLLETEFFGYCKEHATGKHDKNQFCLSCCTGPHCIQGLSESHSGHASIQVRKASHRDVVRVVDIQKYLDIANIQLYSINGAKIVFLQSRPQPKSCKGAPKYCDTCHRSLADQVRFCSINCKRVAVCDASVQDLELTLSPAIDSVSDGTDSTNQGTTNFSPSTPKRHGNHMELNNLSLKMPPFKRQKISEDRSHSLSPMSVLGAGAAFRFDWLDVRDPSTPERHSEFSPRVHCRKQFHPVRAPFF